MSYIREPARDVPVAFECDVCVVGGGCTGTLAAVRAARMGASVALVELNGYFGGVATAGLVSIWHSLRDTGGEKPVIGGLTAEALDRLRERSALAECPSWGAILNTEELKIELDRLVVGAGVRPFLHARFVAPVADGGRVTAVVIEDKNGRRAIRARAFVDATGDGDLVVRSGLPTYRRAVIQPPTTCAFLENLKAIEKANPELRFSEAIFDPRFEGALRPGFAWSAGMPGSRLEMLSGTRVHGADCSDADQLTQAEIEGRRQVRAVCDIVRRNFKDGETLVLAGLPSYIGIRETRHAACLHTVTEKELLGGVRFPDAIGNGTYPVDVHKGDGAGLTFRWLDGRELTVVPNQPSVAARWLPEGAPHAKFYQIPYRALVPRGSANVLVCGRLIDADEGAFGALRVMVNCNQTGEAAGAAAVLAIRAGGGVPEVDPAALRAALREQGCLVV